MNKAANKQRKALGERGRPREATEASSRAQILAQYPESSPLPTPPGPLKPRWFGGNQAASKQRKTMGEQEIPRDTTDASSHAQIFARYPEFNPPPTPPVPLKLRLFGE